MSHPSSAFAWTDIAAMRNVMEQRSFAHLFCATPEGPMVAHAPVVVTPNGDLRFHLARGNRIVRHLNGARLLASIVALDFYVSPDWYQGSDQVPTWNYKAVEAEGLVRPLEKEELVELLDLLSDTHEAQLDPKPRWTRFKMTPGRFEAMLAAIRGFEVKVDALRGTAKLSQNKDEADRAGVVAGLQACGRLQEAALMQGSGAT